MEKYFEKKENLNPREKLLSYEKEGIYLFHGSPNKIEILEPKQAEEYNKKNLRNEKHGEPCVATTPFSEIAIFRSLINPTNCQGSSGFGLNKENNLKFSTTKENLSKINNRDGYVYVFKKSDFVEFSEMEWRTNKKIKYIEFIVVTKKDLPENIDLIDNNFNHLE